MKVYTTTMDSGFSTQEKLYWEFIKAVEMVDEYKLWHKAVIKAEHDLI